MIGAEKSPEFGNHEFTHERFNSRIDSRRAMYMEQGLSKRDILDKLVSEKHILTLAEQAYRNPQQEQGQ
jgi:hypothetical protein